MDNQLYLVKVNASKKKQASYLNQLLINKKPTYYSKSYSENYAALLVSWTKPVAIDIEKKRPLTYQQMDILASFMFNEKDCIGYSKKKIIFLSYG